MKRMDTAVLTMILCFSTMLFASDRTSTYAYTAQGLVASIDGPRTEVSDITTYTYDASGNRSSMTNAIGHVTRFTDYDDAGRLLRMVSPNGLITTFAYHPRGWLMRQTEGEGIDAVTNQFDYDASGNLIRATLSTGAYLDFSYDKANRLTGIADAVGNQLRYSLDETGNRVLEQTLDPEGSVTWTLSRIYSDLNRLQRQIGATADNVTDYTYDANGNRITVNDGLNRTEMSTYDALNRLASITDPASGQTRHAYDPRDNVVSVTDPRGNITGYTYSAFDEITVTTSPDAGTTAYTYDEAGNVLSRTDARGITVHYTYDGLNRLTSISHPDASLDVVFTYDQGIYGIGHMTGMEDAEGTSAYGYDQRGNLVTEHRLTHTGVEINIQYEYDPGGRLVDMTYPSGRKVIYSYDPTGSVVRVSSSFDGQTDVLADDIGRLPFGPANHWTSGNGQTTERRFDQNYRLIGIRVGDLIDRTYAYDAVGNIVSIVEGNDPARDQGFAYDLLDRLSDADGGYGELQFEYDPVGNRLVGQKDSQTTQLSYEPASNRLLANLSSGEHYAHDAAGNRTALVSADGAGWRYSYGEDNRLAQAVHTAWQTFGKGKKRTTRLVEDISATFAYNGKGERVRKTVNAVSTYFHFGPKGELLAEMDDAGNVIREYIYLDAQPLAIANYRTDTVGTPVDVIIENDSVQAVSSGVWALFSDRKGRNHGENYHLAEGGTNSVFRWTLNLSAGAYQLQAWWVADRKNTAEAPFVVHHAGSETIVSADQTTTGGQWVDLGFFRFDGADDEYIEVSDATGRTVADAIRLVGHADAETSLTSAGIHYLHADHLGTPQVLTDAAGDVLWRADYEPFGLTSISGDQAVQMLRFAGQFYDQETGLHYNYFRDYDPSTGRYIQSDPIGLAGGLNSYGYVGGNPLSYSDPYGLFRWHGNWCGGDWTGGYEKQWGQLTSAEWRKVKGPVDPLDSCCVIHDKSYYDCREKYTCDPDARKECFKHADRQLYRCSLGNPINGGFQEWGLREYMRRSRPGPESSRNCCTN